MATTDVAGVAAEMREGPAEAPGPDALSAGARRLRETVLQEAAPFAERSLWLAESFRNTEAEPFREIRVAKAVAHLLAHMPIRIRDGEVLAGWHPSTRPDESTAEAIKEADQYLHRQQWRGFVSEGHMAPDYATVLHCGLGGVRRRIAAAAARLDPSSPEPRTFREAIQLTWFMFLTVALEGGTHHHCFGPGRIDQYLRRFYAAEREAGAVGEVLVDDLLAQLFIKCNEFQGSGMSAVILVVGGRQPDGSDATNQLSYKMLEISDRVRMYFPGVDVSWHSDIDEEFMRRAVALLRNGKGQPSFFNSDVIVRGLVRHGVAFEHAVDCQADLYLESIHRPFPLLSCFIQGCIERGLNISQGGALYNFIQPEAVGVSNVVDGLGAIRTLVDDEARYTLDEFRAAIKADFHGYDELREAILRDCPKHGNDIHWVNELFGEVAGGWCDAFEGHANFLGGPFLPGFLAWTNWIRYGEKTPATPAGRKAGEPLANSIVNCTGVQVKGFPALVLSTAQLDQSRALGGVTFNVRFGANVLAEDKGIRGLKGLMEGAFDVGAYQIQVNLASTEVMRAAQESPDEHSDLLVRIGGYLVPFTLLPRNAQDEVIARTELVM